jgi:1-acyl-sn-glycerol-3-phosphate acyltransferase
MEQLDSLTQINLDDLVSSFGWQNSPVLARAVRGIFHVPAQKFARQVLALDADVAQRGLSLAARDLFDQYAQSLQVFGAQNIPASGPALFLSNHPGMVDTLALFIAIQRADLRIPAGERSFLQTLTHVCPHLIFFTADPVRRMAAVKTTAAHLKAGGAVLTFPAGKIDPDPDVYPGALEALDDWSESAGVFVRFAPQTKVIPTLVRGVLWDKAVKHPLTRLKKTRFEREKLGAAFQLLAHILFDSRPLRVTVQFGEPIEAGTMPAGEIHQKTLEQMRVLINHPPEKVNPSQP